MSAASAASLADRQEATVTQELALRCALSHIEREFGAGTLMRMGEEGAQVRCEAIPTGRGLARSGLEYRRGAAGARRRGLRSGVLG
jgi:hypothetical protein